MAAPQSEETANFVLLETPIKERDPVFCYIDDKATALTLVFKDEVRLYQIDGISAILWKKLKMKGVYCAKCMKVVNSSYLLVLQETKLDNDFSYSFQIYKLVEPNSETITEDLDLVYSESSSQKVYSVKSDGSGNVYVIHADYILKQTFGTWETSRKLCIPVNDSGVCAVGQINGVVAVPLFDEEGRIAFCDTTRSCEFQTSFICGIKGHVQLLEFDSSEKLLAVVNTDGTLIHVFDVKDKSKTVLFNLFRGRNAAEVRSVSFSLNSELIFVTSNRPTVHIFTLCGQELEPESLSKHLSNVFSTLDSDDLLNIVRCQRSNEKVMVTDRERNYVICRPFQEGGSDLGLLVYGNGVFGAHFLDSSGKLKSHVQRHLDDGPEKDDFMEL